MKQTLRRMAAKTIARVIPRGIFVDANHFDIFQDRGIHITPARFGYPVPNTKELDASGFWNRQSELSGIEKNVPGQIAVLSDFEKLGYLKEFNDLPSTPLDRQHFGRNGGDFSGPDGAILYSFIRKSRPRQIIEIGAGHSTLLSIAALDRNDDNGRLRSIEPYPRPYISELTDPKFTLIRSKVEDVPLAEFEQLAPNDILFIDSSHMATIGGDVLYEILEILPRVRPGVLVHIHDIFLPRHYNKDWVMKRQVFWTEQYLLQAFLAFNQSFEILWAFGIMETEQPAALASHFPNFESGQGGSIWLRRLR